MRYLILSVLLMALGCGQALDGSTCSPIPDGTYSAAAGDSYTFLGGAPAGNWSCIPTAGCAGAISCTPIGETVYTVEFVNVGDGEIEATTSPPGRTVRLTREGGV